MFLNVATLIQKLKNSRVFDTDTYELSRTNTKTNPVKLYKQYVIGNNFSIYHLGMNGSPNLDMGMNARTRDK